MNAISEFLRSAVLIDDRVLVEGDDPLEPLSIPDDVSEEPVEGAVEPPGVDATPIYASPLVRAFLHHGVVCGVLQPNENDRGLGDLAALAAQRADLLLLDWFLFGDAAKTIKIITDLIATSDDQFRVVVIYTGTGDLVQVQDSLTEDCGFSLIKPYILRNADVLALIFGKPGVSLLGADADRLAEYDDLPVRIGEDLEAVLGGLVPEIVIAGVNAARTAVPRLLADFGPSLDHAFILHRALLPDPNDAAEQLLDLVSEDIRAAMSAGGGDGVPSSEAIRNYLDAHSEFEDLEATVAEKLKSSEDLDETFKELAPGELMRRAVEVGLQQLGINDNWWNPSRLDPLAAAFPGEDEASEALAALMCSQRLGPMSPRLEMGVIVRNEGAYFLCIQPLCDSVRIEEGGRRFPLVPLNTVLDGKSASVLILDDGEAKRLNFSTSPYSLQNPKFIAAANGAVQGELVDESWKFKDTDDFEYVAVCRLRASFAQQAAHALTSANMRPAVDASEWLRRGIKKTQ